MFNTLDLKKFPDTPQPLGRAVTSDPTGVAWGLRGCHVLQPQNIFIKSKWPFIKTQF